MKIADEFKKASDNFSVIRCTNGFMFEVGGRTHDDEWKTLKFVCGNEAELFDYIKQTNALPID